VRSGSRPTKLQGESKVRGPAPKPRRSRQSNGPDGAEAAAHDPSLVLSVGHSTRPLADFLNLLQAHAATLIADVRTVPRSRHNPQFNQDTLAAAARHAGIQYVHFPGLGGLRHAQRDSVNTGWQNASFRGFADYMQTPPFAQSLDALIKLTQRERVVLMCAEAVPWRCHRSLIADALLVRGIRTEDIMSPTRRAVHRLTSFAQVRGTTITYPAANPSGDQPQPAPKSRRPQTVPA